MTKAFFGGIPTSGDVRLLMEAFGTPSAGQEISHEEIEGCIGVTRHQSRYRTVTQAWRDKLRGEHNIDLSAVPGIGFRSLDASERISAGIKGVRSGMKKQLRGIKRADAASTDDPVLRSKQDLLRRYGIALAAEATKTMQQLEPPKAPTQQPRAIPQH